MFKSPNILCQKASLNSKIISRLKLMFPQLEAEKNKYYDSGSGSSCLVCVDLVGWQSNLL